MALSFDYKARTLRGQRVAGTILAGDSSSAFAALRERMLVPSELVAASSASYRRGVRRTFCKDRLAFFRSFAALEQAGIDFSTAFELLAEQAREPRFRDALANIQAEVERGGEKLWCAMAHRPDAFGALEIAMVAAGEEAGNREQVFARLAALLEREDRLRKQLGAALIYPCVVLVAAVILGGYLLGAILPQFASIFEGFGVPQPPLIAHVHALSQLFSTPVALGITSAGAIVFPAALLRYLATQRGLLLGDRILLRLPVAGEVLRKTAVARLARVLATLLQSGINQVRALEVAAPVAVRPTLTRAIETARERIATGRSAALDEALEATGVFPHLFLAFLKTGARCGNVPQMLLKVAEYYEEDVETLASAIPAVVQTLVTLGLGCVVGSIVYAVYIPLSSLSSGIR